MKYTYRDERVIRDKTDVMCFVRLGIWVCVTLAVFLADGYLIFVKGTDSIGSPVLGGMLCVVVVVMAVSIRRDIQKRRGEAVPRGAFFKADGALPRLRRGRLCMARVVRIHR